MNHLDHPSTLVFLYFTRPAFHSFAREAYAAISSGEQERVEARVAQFRAWRFTVITTLLLVQSLLAFIPSLVLDDGRSRYGREAD